MMTKREKLKAVEALENLATASNQGAGAILEVDEAVQLMGACSEAMALIVKQFNGDTYEEKAHNVASVYTKLKRDYRAYGYMYGILEEHVAYLYH